jgi:proline iminopeptidase
MNCDSSGDTTLFILDPPHRIEYQVAGNPNGLPLLSIHGGPGSGSSPRQIAPVDLDRFRVVQIDQRGCGLSVPTGLLDFNTPAHLIADMEAVRIQLNISRWAVVLAGSWGASLAILYAHEHPLRINQLLLRNTFLCSSGEIEGFFQGQNRNELFRALNSDDAFKQRAAMEIWRGCESRGEKPEPVSEQDFYSALQKYRLQAHYISNGFFISEGYIENCFQGLNIEGIDLLHGSSDLVCPPSNSVRLAQLNSRARFHPIANCGHDPFHPAMIEQTREILCAL